MATGLLEIIQGNEDLPSLPAIFSEVNEAVDDPRTSMGDIADIISSDISLSARILRLVNSAFFGFPSRIDTISHAVTIIGTQQLRDLVLATAVIDLFRGIPSELVNMRSFWQHSIGCGIGSRILASYHREANIEHFFVAGLLHDLGRLILCMKIPDQTKEILTRSIENTELLHRVEREVLGFDHADVGGMLLKSWSLPVSLEEPVKFHHRPTRAIEYTSHSAIVHVGDLISNAMELGSSGERLVPPLDEPAWEGLGLSTSILGPLTKQLDLQYSDTAHLFLEDHDDS